MPSHTSYPESADLEQYLRSLRIFTDADLATALSYLDLEELAAAASDAWERETGWQPFLADSSANVTRYFDPPGPNQFRGGTRGGGRTLFLDAGLITVTSIHNGWSPTTDGTSLVEHTDYRLEPYNATLRNEPYTRIEALSTNWGDGRSIRIIGKWGYAETLPDSAWQAILQYGMALAYPELRERRTRGLIEWDQAGTSEKYGEDYLKVSAGVWQSHFQRTAMRFKRVLL